MFSVVNYISNMMLAKDNIDISLSLKIRLVGLEIFYFFFTNSSFFICHNLISPIRTPTKFSKKPSMQKYNLPRGWGLKRTEINTTRVYNGGQVYILVPGPAFTLRDLWDLKWFVLVFKMVLVFVFEKPFYLPIKIFLKIIF